MIEKANDICPRCGKSREKHITHDSIPGMAFCPDEKTDEQVVKETQKEAIVVSTPSWFPLTFRVYSNSRLSKVLGEGTTKPNAWHAAAERIRKEQKS